jgi:hypothetical protein
MATEEFDGGGAVQGVHGANRRSWPPKLAAVVAVIVGIFLLLAGGGHLSAILGTRAGQPFDYRFVSLLTTSGILIVPGLVGIATSYWLWRGRSWAYVSCLLSTGALMLYLSLLLYMKTQVPAGSTAAGDEVYVVTGLASVHLVVIGSVSWWLQRGRPRESSAVTARPSSA